MKRFYLLGFCLMMYLATNTYAKSSYTTIFPDNIYVSSSLGDNSLKVINNYSPYYVIDDNPNTAWVEGADGDGIGESLILDFSYGVKTDSLAVYIRNGFQKSNDLFLKNNRVKELDIKLFSVINNKTEVVSNQVTLKDEMDWQTITLSPQNTFVKIELVIKSVYKGISYQDTCISDIKIGVSNTTSIDNQKQDDYKNRFNKWFEERQKKAKFFASLPKNYPFLDYKKSHYKRQIPIDDATINLNLIDKVFNDTEWAKFSSSESKTIKNLSNINVNQGKNCKIEYIGLTFYEPNVISGISADICSFLISSAIKITLTKTSNPSYRVIYSGNKLVQISAIDTEGSLLNYYYNEVGKLLYIKDRTSIEDGELINNIFFQWDKEKVLRIFQIYAYEKGKNIVLELSIYQ
jgi:hypothetical protein